MRLSRLRPGLLPLKRVLRRPQIPLGDVQIFEARPFRHVRACAGREIVHDEHVFVTSGYGVGCRCLEVKKSGDKFAATELWNNKQVVNHHGGVIRIGPNVYGHSDSKGWTCQDIKTGEVRWQDKTFGKGSIAHGDNRFILRTEDKGSLALIEASPDGYKEHGKFEQPNRSKEKAWAHPVISNGKLYLRDEDHLLCYDISARS